METFIAPETSATVVREVHYTNVKWRAVFGGWLVALATALLLYTVGTAIGISVINFTDAEALNAKTATLSAMWVLITWIVALYLGSYFASALANDGEKHNGVLHGIGVWALSTVLTVFVAAAGIGTLGAVLTGGLLVAGPQVAEQVSKTPMSFQTEIKDAVGAQAAKETANPNFRRAVRELDAETLTAVGSDFVRGDQNAAADSLAYHTSLNRAEAQQVVNNLSAKIEEAKARLKEAKDKVAKFTTAALASSVLISLISLLAAIAGGSAGARMYFQVLQTRRTRV